MDDDALQIQPIDALLAAYAAGTLSAPLAALVEAHLELKPEGRRFVAALAALGGVLLDGIVPTPLRDRDIVLAGALAVSPDQASVVSSHVAQSDLLPQSLLRLIGRDPMELAWRSAVPGLWECRIVVGPDIQASLMRMTAGARLPEHRHSGDEVVLVLDGGFSDASGDYHRGDVEIADETFSHRPVAHRDRDCLVFVVRDRPEKGLGPIGRIFPLFSGDES